MRKRRKIRESTIQVAWFSSRTELSIPHPPVLPPDWGLREGDIYLHEYPPNVQAWRCTQLDPVTWQTLAPGEKRILPGETFERSFALTDSGAPSWVRQGTFNRLYASKHSAARSSSGIASILAS